MAKKESLLVRRPDDDDRPVINSRDLDEQSNAPAGRTDDLPVNDYFSYADPEEKDEYRKPPEEDTHTEDIPSENHREGDHKPGKKSKGKNEKEDNEKEKKKTGFGRHLIRTFNVVIVLFAVAIILSYTVFPVLQVNGKAMQPTFEPGDIAICYKTTSLTYDDVCSFYRNNNLYVRRVVAVAGDTFDLDEDGYVLINGDRKEISIQTTDSQGDIIQDLPYRVPEDEYLVIGDNMEEETLEAVKIENLLGGVAVRIYPFNRISWYGFK